MRLWLTAIVCLRGYAGLYMLYRRNVITRPRPSSPVVSRNRCFMLARSRENLCRSSLFDFRMTIKCTACSWYHGFTGSCRHRVLYLMHMCLINDVVYQKGSMRLITRVHGIRPNLQPLNKAGVYSREAFVWWNAVHIWSCRGAIAKNSSDVAYIVLWILMYSFKKQLWAVRMYMYTERDGQAACTQLV